MFKFYSKIFSSAFYARFSARCLTFLPVVRYKSALSINIYCFKLIRKVSAVLTCTHSISRRVALQAGGDIIMREVEVR